MEKSIERQYYEFCRDARRKAEKAFALAPTQKEADVLENAWRELKRVESVAFRAYTETIHSPLASSVG